MFLSNMCYDNERLSGPKIGSEKRIVVIAAIVGSRGNIAKHDAYAKRLLGLL